MNNTWLTGDIHEIPNDGIRGLDKEHYDTQIRLVSNILNENISLEEKIDKLSRLALIAYKIGFLNGYRGCANEPTSLIIL